METLLLIHSAWAGGWMWHRVERRLRALGHRCVVVDRLPSGGDDPGTLGDLEADVEHVRGVLDGLHAPVRVVAHSYASMVAAEVVDHPAVGSVVHLAGVWPRTGESAMEIVSADPGQVFYEAHDTSSLRVVRDVDLLHRILAADLRRQDVVGALPRTGLQSISSLMSPSRAPSAQPRSTYVVCTQDRILPPSLQERMARRAVRVVRLASSHLPLLSLPDEVVEVILEDQPSAENLQVERWR